MSKFWEIFCKNQETKTLLRHFLVRRHNQLVVAVVEASQHTIVATFSGYTP